MVIFGFCHRSNAVHEIQGRLEIVELISLDDVVVLNNFPAPDLSLQRLDLVGSQGRRSAAAGDAFFGGQCTHAGLLERERDPHAPTCVYEPGSIPWTMRRPAP